MGKDEKLIVIDEEDMKREPIKKPLEDEKAESDDDLNKKFRDYVDGKK